MHNLPNLEQCCYLMKYTFRQKKNAINVLALTTYVIIYLTWFILHIISASCFVLDLFCWIILKPVVAILREVEELREVC